MDLFSLFLVLFLIIFFKFEEVLLLSNHILFTALDAVKDVRIFSLIDTTIGICNPFTRYTPKKDGIFLYAKPANEATVSFMKQFKGNRDLSKCEVQFLIDDSGGNYGMTEIEWKNNTRYDVLRRVSNSLPVKFEEIAAMRTDRSFLNCYVISEIRSLPTSTDFKGCLRLIDFMSKMDEHNHNSRIAKIYFDRVCSSLLEKDEGSVFKTFTVGDSEVELSCLRDSINLKVKSGEVVFKNITFIPNGYNEPNLYNLMVKTEGYKIPVEKDVKNCFGMFKVAHCLDLNSILNREDYIDFEEGSVDGSVFIQTSDSKVVFITCLASVISAVIGGLMDWSGSRVLFYIFLSLSFILSFVLVIILIQFMKGTLKIKYFVYLMLKSILSEGKLVRIYRDLKIRGSSFSFCNFKTLLPTAYERVVTIGVYSMENMVFDSELQYGWEEKRNFRITVGESRISCTFSGAELGNDRIPVNDVCVSNFFSDASDDVNLKLPPTLNLRVVWSSCETGETIKTKSWMINNTQLICFNGWRKCLEMIKNDEIQGFYSNSFISLNKVFGHFFDPIEALDNMFNNKGHKIVVWKKDPFCRKEFVSASVKVGITKEFDVKRKVSGLDNKNFVSIAYYNALFFGRLHLNLCCCVTPGQKVFPKDFDIPNKQLKLYLSDLSEIFLGFGMRRLPKITKFKNFTIAKSKMLEKLRTEEFELEIVDNLESVYIKDGTRNYPVQVETQHLVGETDSMVLNKGSCEKREIEVVFSQQVEEILQNSLRFINGKIDEVESKTGLPISEFTSPGGEGVDKVISKVMVEDDISKKFSEFIGNELNRLKIEKPNSITKKVRKSPKEELKKIITQRPGYKERLGSLIDEIASASFEKTTELIGPLMEFNGSIYNNPEMYVDLMSKQKRIEEKKNKLCIPSGVKVSSYKSKILIKQNRNGVGNAVKVIEEPKTALGVKISDSHSPRKVVIDLGEDLIGNISSVKISRRSQFIGKAKKLGLNKWKKEEDCDPKRTKIILSRNSRRSPKSLEFLKNGTQINEVMANIHREGGFGFKSRLREGGAKGKKFLFKSIVKFALSKFKAEFGGVEIEVSSPLSRKIEGQQFKMEELDIIIDKIRDNRNLEKSDIKSKIRIIISNVSRRAMDMFYDSI